MFSGCFHDDEAVHQIGKLQLAFDGDGMLHQIGEDHHALFAADAGDVAHDDALGGLFVLINSGKAHTVSSLFGCEAGQHHTQAHIALLEIGDRGHDLLVSGSVAGLLQLTGKQGNTPEGDVVSSIAVAASSIMTVIILSIAALFVTAISPIFELPAVKTMADYLLPSMFGSMALGLFSSSKSGSTVVIGGIKGVIPVIVIVSIISLFANIAGFGSTLLGMVGLIILCMLPISIITSRVLWKKGKIKVVENVAEEAPKAE